MTAAGALTDQPLTHAVERLQIELLGSLSRDKLHSRTLHRLGDGFRVEAKSKGKAPVR